MIIFRTGPLFISPVGERVSCGKYYCYYTSLETLFLIFQLSEHVNKLFTHFCDGVYTPSASLRVKMEEGTRLER